MQHKSPFHYATLALACAGLLVILNYGLLPGLLSCLLAVVLTQGLCSLLTEKAGLGDKFTKWVSAGLVILAPIVIVGLVGVELAKFASKAAANYSELMEHVTRVALEWSAKLPPAITALLPTNPDDLKTELHAKIQSQLPQMAGWSRSWAGGLLFVIVGFIVGALIAIRKRAAQEDETPPLTEAIQARARNLLYVFRKVVVVQFWIAAVNTTFTAILLLVAFPLFGVKVPFAPWLVLLTFVAGLIPIVGNLLCNVVLTLAGLGVGPHIAVVCLIYLIAVHKLEYIINATILGSQIGTTVWELLIVMFVGEALFGVIGLVAGPLYYAYLRIELKQLKWI